MERRPPFDFVALYIPANPFHSLANNVVPAVVLFSVLVGVALIGVERKQVLLDVLQVVGEAVSRATRARDEADAVRPVRDCRDGRRHAQRRATRPAADLSADLRRARAGASASGCCPGWWRR